MGGGGRTVVSPAVSRAGPPNGSTWTGGRCLTPVGRQPDVIARVHTGSFAGTTQRHLAWCSNGRYIIEMGIEPNPNPDFSIKVDVHIHC